MPDIPRCPNRGPLTWTRLCSTIAIPDTQQTDLTGQSAWPSKDRPVGTDQTSRVNVSDEDWWEWSAMGGKLNWSVFSSLLWPTPRSRQWISRRRVLHLWLPHNASLRTWLRTGWKTGTLLPSGRFLDTERDTDLCLWVSFNQFKRFTVAAVLTCCNFFFNSHSSAPLSLSLLLCTTLTDHSAPCLLLHTLPLNQLTALHQHPLFKLLRRRNKKAAKSICC